jgi:four helix bundle protein
MRNGDGVGAASSNIAVRVEDVTGVTGHGAAWFGSTWAIMPERRYDLEDRLIDFAAQICVLTDGFPSTAVARHVSAQIVRSGTSPFANYAEAQAAESRQDFVHKLKICLKELRETQAWLKFVERMSYSPEKTRAVRDVASVRTARAKVKTSNVQ